MKAKRHFAFHLYSVPRCRPQHLSVPQLRRCSAWLPDGVALSNATPVKPPPPPPPPPPDMFVLISFCAQPPGRQVKVYPHTTHTISLTCRPGEEHSAPEARASPNGSHNSAAITTSTVADRKTESAFHTISRRPVFISPIAASFPHPSSAPPPFIWLYIIDFCQW